MSSFVKTLEGKIITSNMEMLNDFLNSNYGFAKVQRKTILYKVKPKKLNYDDYQQAYEYAAAGYSGLASNEKVAFEKLSLAVGLWEKALGESDPNDKKARVNANITIITLFNLIEAHIWMHDYEKASTRLNKISGLKPNKKEQSKVNTLRDLIGDQKTRWDAGQ